MLIGQNGTSLDRFEEIYSQWANEHPEYECELNPEIDLGRSELVKIPFYKVVRLWGNGGV